MSKAAVSHGARWALFALAATTGFVVAAVAWPTRDWSAIERKLGEINRKLDHAFERQPPAQRPRGPDPAKKYIVPIDGDPFVGPADAKVTIVEGFDYACPYCNKVRPTLDALRAKYGDDLRIVYKPFVVHEATATTGALALCAAAEQGKAIEMDALLWEKGFAAREFDADRCWESGTCGVVDGFARALQLDPRFDADLRACKQHLDKDMADLRALGVTGTPAFFINGHYLSGAQPIEQFTALIDAELR